MTCRGTLLGLAATGALCAAPTVAQQAPTSAPPVTPAAAPACRPDTAQMVADSGVDTLWAWIPHRRAHEREAEYRFRVAQVTAVLAALHPPVEVGEEAGGVPPYPHPPAGASELREARPLVWFQVRSDGRLAGLSLEHRSVWPRLDRAIEAAVLHADSGRKLAPLPRELADEPVDLRVAVGTHRLDDADNVVVATRPWQSRHLANGRAEPPRLLTIGYRPRFPAAAIQQHLGDSLVVGFYVDTSGFVEPGSIVPVQATYREFAEEAVKALRSARFSPARLGGCPVRVRAQMSIPFIFTDR